jgi:Flp pilus assembly pilin Flp
MTDRMILPEEAHDGQGMVEYALILVLIAVAVFATLQLVGPVLVEAFQRVVDSFP